MFSIQLSNLPFFYGQIEQICNQFLLVFFSWQPLRYYVNRITLELCLDSLKKESDRSLSFVQLFFCTQMQLIKLFMLAEDIFVEHLKPLLSNLPP